jgi:hypothetical protein
MPFVQLAMNQLGRKAENGPNIWNWKRPNCRKQFKGKFQLENNKLFIKINLGLRKGHMRKITMKVTPIYLMEI